jgi:dTDP-L-rhamnose 4-epimerase
MKNKKIAIITGGLGFIGTNLVSEIEHRFDQVIIVDSLSERVHGINPEIKSSRHQIVIGQVQDQKTWSEVSNLFPKENCSLEIFHLASDTSTANSLINPSAHVSTNILGTSTLLEFLYEYQEQIRRIVLSSTRAVYGEGIWKMSNGDLVCPDQRTNANLDSCIWNPFFEKNLCIEPMGISAQSASTNPTNIYGSTKLCQELILRNWCDSYDVPLNVFRLQNVYGPGQSLWNSYSGVISLFVRNALSGQPIEVYEGGGIIRDLIYVNDVVKILGLDRDFPAGVKVIDVGSGIPITLFEVAKTISNYCGAENPVISRKYRIGDVRGIYADNSKLTYFFNDLKITDLSIGIAELVNWAEIEIRKEAK